MLKGSLFTREFLTEGIRNHDEWKNLPDDLVNEFRADLHRVFQTFPIGGNPNETTTERDLIEPVLKMLDWEHYLTQQTTSRKGRKDVPDFLLFSEQSSKQKANREKQQADRFKHGTAILEAKAWDVPLDRKGNDADFAEGVPSNQILRYLSRVETQSEGRIRWGILTNGRYWRLYYQGAKSRSEEFLELDLPLILSLDGFEPDLFDYEELRAQDWLRVFYLLFYRQAFVPGPPENKTFHERALDEGRFWEAQVAQSLSGVVFLDVFPQLVQRLKEHDPQAPAEPGGAYLDALRHAALTLLYRLLFVLYAEDRRLLPVADKKYDDYGLRKIREDIAARTDRKDVFSAGRDDYYRKLCNLFKSIDKGDPSIGLPPYNGGLFDREQNALLNRAELPDSVFAPLLDMLSRQEGNGRRKWINYRDLSVQQLGSIYERLLEFELVMEGGGNLAVRPNIFARKTSGSYYTPESLVKLVLEKAVGLLLDEKLDAFKNKSEELKSRRTPKKERVGELSRHDPASAMLGTRVCDPAMGSGHFLVSLVDFLADRALEAVAEAEALVDWADADDPYVSPLAGKIRAIREQIKEQAVVHGWIVKQDQLDDRHIVRRMILKRCVFGVDKNPMAVELAKVSLWLHTFTVGAPLSFLDHHLRCGDSLFGEFVRGAEDYLQNRGSMFIGNEVQQAKATAKGMAAIETTPDANIAEVRESASLFGVIDNATRPLNRFFDFLHATHWLENDLETKMAVNGILDQQYGNPMKLIAGGIPPDAPEEVKTVLAWTRELADEERFLHWEIAFPGVWDQWENVEPKGGFDAVIGNPPWDKIKLQEVEWFAARKTEIALAARASDRKKMIGKLEKQNDPLWHAYLKAGERTQAMASVARENDQYPLLSGGDINLYSLFIERAHRLIKPKGMVGLLAPSGIASDKGASEFFKTVSTTGRLAGFYDFENKKIFFPDVHASFKFCAYVAGGRERVFPETRMAFFLHDTAEIADPDRCFALGAVDFARVNPNTGTAPIFRTRRDAEITRRIYERFPVLHHHQKGKVWPKVWPVEYHTMFHMTNDSRLFKTRRELEKGGFYPVEGNRWKKGKKEYVPLYVGKMIYHYDHRASSVAVNPDNIHNVASSEETTLEQHENPAYYPVPQFWVDSDQIDSSKKLFWVNELRVAQNKNILITLIEQFSWTIGFRDVTNTTNARTMIATIMPLYGVGNTVPLILPDGIERFENYKLTSPFLLANLNSFVFDYIVRQKVQGQHLNWYIVEQLPVIPPDKFEGKVGKMKIADFIRREVLRLTYTACDMEPFARDIGYTGKPFVWDEVDRRHRQAKLDALFFNLYGIGEEEAGYILDTFPIVKREDEAGFDGRYYTKELILAYMRALKAGDAEANICL